MFGDRRPQAKKALLRKILIWQLPPPWKLLVDDLAYRLDTTLSKSKGDNGANDNAANASKRNAFQEHAVAKKYHLRNLFFTIIAGIQPSLLHSRGALIGNIRVLLPRIYAR